MRERNSLYVFWVATVLGLMKPGGKWPAQVAVAHGRYSNRPRMGPKGGPHETQFSTFSKIKMDITND